MLYDLKILFQDSEWNIKIFPRQAGTEQRQKVDQWLPRTVGKREWEMSTEKEFLLGMISGGISGDSCATL